MWGCLKRGFPPRSSRGAPCPDTTHCPLAYEGQTGDGVGRCHSRIDAGETPIRIPENYLDISQVPVSPTSPARLFPIDSVSLTPFNRFRSVGSGCYIQKQPAMAQIQSLWLSGLSAQYWDDAFDRA